MRSKLRQDSPLEIYPIRMTAAHAIYARRRGFGNLSDGTRLLIEAEMLAEQSQTCLKSGTKPAEVVQSDHLGKSN